MANNKLSHSSANVFMTCGKKYDYHYNQRLREKVISGALLFGTAIDEAINGAMKDVKESTLDPTWAKYHDLFNRHWELGTINKVEQSLVRNTKLVYAASDLDLELLTEADLKHVEYLLKDYVSLEVFAKGVKEQKAAIGWNKIAKDKKEGYNLLNWLSLRQKGHLMIEAYRTKIFPKFKEIIEVQKKVELENDTGDAITGFIDLIVRLQDDTLVVLDNKTSSRDYELDSVKNSQQLALYKFFSEATYGPMKAGYAVMYKGIKKNRKKICNKCSFDGSASRARSCDNQIEGKRCPGEWLETIEPECEVDFIIDDISQHVQELIVHNFENVNKLIKTGVFTRNFDACKGKFGLCPYYNLCWNNSNEGLEKIE